MSETIPSPLESALDAAVSAYAVLPTKPTLDNAYVHAMCNDVAQKIHPVEELAARYGLPDGESLVRYLKAHPPLLQRIKELRAIWESGGAIESRTRTLACHTALYGLPDVGAVLFDKVTPQSIKLETLKVLARIAGIDGLPPAQKGDPGLGGHFSVIINLPGHTESIRTTVVEHQLLPATQGTLA